MVLVKVADVSWVVTHTRDALYPTPSQFPFMNE